jgi:hypothetical protein
MEVIASSWQSSQQRIAATFHNEDEQGRLHCYLLLTSISPLLLYWMYALMKNRNTPRLNSLVENGTIDVSGHESTDVNITSVSTKSQGSIVGCDDDVMFIKREKLIEEFVGSETKYLAKLSKLNDMFIKPFKDKLILTEENYHLLLFDTLSEVHQKHKRLRESFKKISKQNVAYLLAKQFITFVPHLASYSNYFADYHALQSKRGELFSTNAKFSTFLSKSDTQFKDLENLLREPIKRFHEYALFLEKFQDTLPIGDFDRAESTKCLQIIREIIGKDTLNNSDWKKRLGVIDMMTSLTSSTRINLLDAPNRVLIKEGVLKKQCRKAVKPFYFWLFTDKIVYGEKSGMANSASGRYVFHRMIDLVSSRISKLSAKNHEHVANIDQGFLIECPAKSFIVWAASHTECDKWLENIQDCTQKVRKHMEVEHDIVAPMWVPDQECTVCKLCHTKFTLFTRRHHCRSCGRVVCGTCSGRQWLLTHVDTEKEVRTCDECFGNLSANTTPAGSPVKNIHSPL